MEKNNSRTYQTKCSQCGKFVKNWGDCLECATQENPTEDIHCDNDSCHRKYKIKAKLEEYTR